MLHLYCYFASEFVSISHKNNLKKYHKYDEAEKNEKVYNDKTTLLMPGTADTNFDEPNTKPPYPQSNIPYSQGEIWSDYFQTCFYVYR